MRLFSLVSSEAVSSAALPAISLAALSFAGVVLAGAITAQAADKAPGGRQRVYIGTYTNGDKSRGIYRCELDLATGKLSEPVLAGESVNPSFLAIHPNRKFLYTVSEVSMIDGKKSGGVAGFAIDPATGDLQRLNIEPCGGAGPCHIIVDKTGTHVLLANYGGGSASVLPIGEDGKLGPLSGFAQHEAVMDGDRKAVPHAHSVNLDPSGKYAYVADAGVDKVFIYQYDADHGKITPNDPPAGLVPPRAAPRHFAFHPDGKHAYVINEAMLSVTVFDYDAKNGALTATQTISTVPEGIERKGFSTAEVVVHPTGKFLYGSNRGHNSIAAFKVNPENGQLTSIGNFGKGLIGVPRNFNVDPTGKYALVAGQDTHTVVVFRIDPETGALEPAGSQIEVGSPVCIKFFPLP